MKLASTKLAFTIALLVCIALLGGCQNTTFENPPAEKMAACDPHFVGKWRLTNPDEKRSEDKGFFVIVERDCKRWRFIEDGKDDEKTEASTHFAFASLGDLSLLTVRDDADASNKNDAQARWKNGYFYLRYELVDKSVRLYPIDHKHLAHLIVDGAVHGRTERISREPESAPRNGDFASRDRDELQNFVAGDAAEMARVAQLANIFTHSEFYTLKPATDAEIFKAVKKPAKP